MFSIGETELSSNRKHPGSPRLLAALKGQLNFGLLVKSVLAF